MNQRIVIIALIGVLLTGGTIFELIRKKKLMEKYALLWFGSILVMVVLTIWRELLEKVAALMGVYYAPSALFLIAFFCGLLVMLHVTIVISSLTEQNVILAQKVSLLEMKLERLSQKTGDIEL